MATFIKREMPSNESNKCLLLGHFSYWLIQPLKVGNTDNTCRRFRSTYGFVAWQRQQLLKALDHVDEMETEGFVEENVQNHVG